MQPFEYNFDFHRPSYHFVPPFNWMNDPNGLILWKDTYHLFYQHNPFESIWGRMYWGHAISKDLIRWKHKPIALSPGNNGPDCDGCWSGITVIQNNRPVVIYSGNQDSQQRCCLAYSNDNLETLEKFAGNPVIPDPPSGYSLTGFRDHCVWHNDDFWYQIIGAGIEGQNGAVFLYRSKDLIQWEYLNPLIIGDNHMTAPLSAGNIWECPDFFPLGDQYVLIVSIDEKKPTYTGYFLGDYKDYHFFPNKFQKLDYGDMEFYAPQSFVDDSGKRIQFGWIAEGRSVDAQREAGWAGVLSLPRILSMQSDKCINVQPHPNIQKLRGDHTHLTKTIIKPGYDLPLPKLGAAVEILIEFSAQEQITARRYGLKICSSPNGQEETQIIFHHDTCRLEINRHHSSLDDQTLKIPRGGLLNLENREGLYLHIFIDHSVIEIFANNRQTITCRVYPTHPESTGISIFTEGGSTSIKQIDAWKMQSIW